MLIDATVIAVERSKYCIVININATSKATSKSQDCIMIHIDASAKAEKGRNTAL